MSSVEFVQERLRADIAPRSIGSGKQRLDHARRVLGRRGWTANRTKDCWFADPRISITADEMRDIEEITGVRYGRAEREQIDELITRADALLHGQDPDFYSSFVDAVRAMARALHRP